MIYSFLVPTKAKLIIAIVLLILSFLIGLFYVNLAGMSSTNLDIAAAIFIPFSIEAFFDSIFRRTVQDYRTCIFPNCNFLITLLTWFFSAAIYYILACVVAYIFRNKTSTINK